MDDELVHVHHGHDRVQVHERAELGQVDDQDLFHPGLGVDHLLGHLLDGLGAGALAHADGDGLLVENQGVAPLDGPALAPLVPVGHLAVHRVIAEDVVRKQGLPLADLIGHVADDHAVAQTGEGVPGEVEVGHGLGVEGEVLLGVVHQVVLAQLGDLALAHAAGHGVEHLVRGQGQQILLHGLLHVGAVEVGLGHVVVHQVLPDAGPVHGLAQQILQVHHVHAALPQGAGEGVVLLLGVDEVGDVVKELMGQIIGHQVFQLHTRAVQQHRVELADFGTDADGGFHGSKNSPSFEFQFSPETRKRPPFFSGRRCFHTCIVSRIFLIFNRKPKKKYYSASCIFIMIYNTESP